MTDAPVLDRVIGQERAVALLKASVPAPVHAYLFVGPPGTGKRDAAIAFAAALMCPNGGCGDCPACRDAIAERHPDLVVVERRGPYITMDQAREVVRLAARSPRAGKYQVLILVDFHLVEDRAPVVLKTIEEPADTTVIIVLAESIPVELVTIASRCLRVDFETLGQGDITQVLEREGVQAAAAQAAASAAAGRLDRARLLARDHGAGERLALWRSVPSRLDGTGATVTALAAELLAANAEPVEVVKARQAEEWAELNEMAERSGERTIPGRQLIEDRHRREQRRVRADEMRAGLAVLASTYRGRLGDPLTSSQIAAQVKAIGAIDEATERLQRNVGETLLLEWLLCRLDASA
jgi:DNA polymerase-3 subunit delta'